MSTLTGSIAIGYINLADGQTITATTSTTGYPASNLSTPDLRTLWRGTLTGQTVIADLGVSTGNIDIVSLIGFNGTDIATAAILTSENSDLSSSEYSSGPIDMFDLTYPGLPTYTPPYGRNFIHFPGSTKNSRYVGVEIDDDVDNQLQARVFWAGPIWQPQVTFASGFRKALEPIGVPGVERALATLEVDLDALTEAEGRTLETLCLERLRTGRLLVVPRPSQPATWASEALYCVLKGYPRLTAWAQGGGEMRWKVTLTFKECED